MPPRTRHAARALLLTPQREILLMRMAFPWDTSDLWMLPGGGIEAGETAEQACVRELREETGLRVDTKLIEVWRREFLAKRADVYVKQNYFLLEVAKFTPEPAAFTPDEDDWFREFRWWTRDAVACSTERIEPRALAAGIDQIDAEGPPSIPFDIDTL